MFEVLIETANRNPRHVRCLHDACGIGRGEDNLVVLQGWNIAREHALLQLRGGGIFIEVLGGRAPVTVNGTRVNDAHGPLQRDDLVGIGAYRLRVLVDQAVTEMHAAKLPSKAANAGDGASSAVPLPAESGKTVTGLPSPIVHTDMLEWRTRVHQSLVKQMDLRRVDVRGMSDADLREKTSALIDDIIRGEFADKLPKTINRRRLAKEVLDEAIGLGPLEDLLDDDSVTEIMVNKADDIYIERAGRIETSPVVFTSDKAVLAAIERIVTPLGRRIDESSPMVDARLADGSRVNAVIPPVALRGPSISIRKFSKRKLTGDDLLEFGSTSEPMLEFMRMAVHERKNIVVTGGTGSGKTTLLNILSNFIPDEERIVTIEDAAELRLSQPNLVSMESRPPNLEGKGQITIRDLVRNSLRMRPDRIVVGEVRGPEVLEMLQAMNTGHDGSMATIHANSPRDCLSRIEMLAGFAGFQGSDDSLRRQVAGAVDFIVQIGRLGKGQRRVLSITEVTGISDNVITMQDLFKHELRTDSVGKEFDHWVSPGFRPHTHKLKNWHRQQMQESSP